MLSFIYLFMLLLVYESSIGTDDIKLILTRKQYINKQIAIGLGKHLYRRTLANAIIFAVWLLMSQ